MRDALRNLGNATVFAGGLALFSTGAILVCLWTLMSPPEGSARGLVQAAAWLLRKAEVWAPAAFGIFVSARIAWPVIRNFESRVGQVVGAALLIPLTAVPVGALAFGVCRAAFDPAPFRLADIGRSFVTALLAGAWLLVPPLAILAGLWAGLYLVLSARR